MARLLEARRRRGVEIRVLGGVGERRTDVPVRRLRALRLHARVIVCDQREAFLGSQSLRQMELDLRREVGLIVRHPAIVGRLVETFEADWVASR